MTTELLKQALGALLHHQGAGCTSTWEATDSAIKAIRAHLASPAKQLEASDKWKCGNEFLPYHPKASHVNPDHRDGWNACYAAAMLLAAPPTLKEPT